MRNKVFFDTNLLVYAYNSDDMGKHEIAFNLLKSWDYDTEKLISIQVLNEFSSCLIKHKISLQVIEDYLKEIINSINIHQIRTHTTLNAVKLKQKYGYSWWDSLLLSSALENNCSIIYSEDMQHCQIIENSLKIINPFV